MSTITKKLGIIEILKNIFGNDEVAQLPDELKVAQERADQIMIKSNDVANVAATKKTSGKTKKGGIVEQVDVKNIEFSDKMIKTYNEIKKGQERE